MKPIARLIGRLALFLLVAGVASGCENVRPIYQVESRPMPELSKPLTLNQIEARIIKAGKMKNWSVRAIEPGRIRGTLTIRRRSAVVAIDYDLQTFSIRYKSSYKLYAGKAWPGQAYEGEFVIHRKYNGRVRALERAIVRELSFPDT